MDDWPWVTDEAFVAAIAATPGIKRRELACTLGVPTPHVDRRVRKLADAGRIVMQRDWNQTNGPWRYTATETTGAKHPSLTTTSPSEQQLNPCDIAALIEIADAAWQWEVIDLDSDEDEIFDVVCERLRAALKGYRPRNVHPKLHHHTIA